MKKIIFLLAFALLSSCMALTSLQAAPHPHAAPKHANAPRTGRHTTNTHGRNERTHRRGKGRTHKRTHARKHADKLRIVQIKIDDVVVYRDRAFYKHGHEHDGKHHGMHRDGMRYDKHYEGTRHGAHDGTHHGHHGRAA